MSNTWYRNNVLGLKREAFQRETEDKKIGLFILKNKIGIEMVITNFVGIVSPIMTSKKHGKYADTIFRNSSIDEIILSPKTFLSLTIEYYSNRIAKEKFAFDSEKGFSGKLGIILIYKLKKIMNSLSVTKQQLLKERKSTLLTIFYYLAAFLLLLQTSKAT